jgi:hypothetical protein
MKRHLLAGLAAAALVVGLSASSANAQCAFNHPKRARTFKSSFVSAFVSCDNPGGSTDNTTAGGGAVPACKPPITRAEDQGNPAGTWVWNPDKGEGSVQIKSVKLTQIPGVFPTDSSDVKIIMKLKGVNHMGGGGPVNGATGQLSTVSRTTFDDRDSGDVTVVDFPLNFAFTLFNGSTTLKRTADQQLNATPTTPPGGLAGLPHCTQLETVSITVLDENGNPFANMGIFMPEL